MANGFDFDEEIDRRMVPALKVDPMVLGSNWKNVFPGGVADMDFRVSQPVRDALHHRAAHGVFGYEGTPSGLIPALTNWLSARHDWTVDPVQILQAPNVLNALAMAARLFVDEGDAIIVQPPVYFSFFKIIAENKRRLVSNPLALVRGHYQMDFAGLERLASDLHTRMLFLCNPHNPVGRVWTRDELLRVGEICRAHDVLVVADEIHGDIVFPGHAYTPFASISKEDAQNSITCVSPAKTFNIEACSSSFTIVPDDTRRATVQSEIDRLTLNNNNAFANVAMEAAYREGGPWLDAVLGYLSGNLALVRERLTGLHGVTLIEPEGTFLLWLDFHGLKLDRDALNCFLRDCAGWSIAEGPAFGKEGAGFARLNIACPRSRLKAALDRLANAIHAGDFRVEQDASSA